LCKSRWCVGDCAFYRIDAFTGVFKNNIVRVIHEVGVVAFAAVHEVCAGAAIEGVIPIQPV
jgi:hypothetical protein